MIKATKLNLEYKSYHQVDIEVELNNYNEDNKTEYTLDNIENATVKWNTMYVKLLDSDKVLEIDIDHLLNDPEAIDWKYPTDETVVNDDLTFEEINGDFQTIQTTYKNFVNYQLNIANKILKAEVGNDMEITINDDERFVKAAMMLAYNVSNYPKLEVSSEWVRLCDLNGIEQ